MSLIRALTIAGKIGLAGLVSGCAAAPAGKTSINDVNENVSADEPQQNIKADHDYADGSAVVLKNGSFFVRTKEGGWQFYSAKCKESDDHIVPEPGPGEEGTYDISDAISAGATLYESGLPTTHPCYRPPKSQKKR
jgi:hypothetical protein